MIRKYVVVALAILVAGCSTFRSALQPAATTPDNYVVFFSPRTAELAPEAQAIVRQAALAARQKKASRIEIAVPPRVPGGPDVVEGRYTAIQNIISSTGVANPAYSRALLSSDLVGLPGGTDRAEIRLIR